MIYLTGDVHTKIKNHWEQKISEDEVANAKKYLEILKEHKIASTLFINGKCICENRGKVKELLNYDVELGGHTYDNFGSMPPLKSYAYRKMYGCIYGSPSFQRKDIQKTKKAFRKIGITINSWRTHSFGSNNSTYKILKQEGINIVSDTVGEVKPFEREGLMHMPINIPVDVVTISYGEWKTESRNPFASCVKGRIQANEWLDIIKKRIIDNEKKNIDSILLIHPETMAVLDNFKIFKEIAKFLSKYKTQKISEYKRIC